MGEVSYINDLEVKVRELEQRIEDRPKTIDTQRNRIKELEYRNAYLEKRFMELGLTAWSWEVAREGMV